MFSQEDMLQSSVSLVNFVICKWINDAFTEPQLLIGFLARESTVALAKNTCFPGRSDGMLSTSFGLFKHWIILRENFVGRTLLQQMKEERVKEQNALLGPPVERLE